MNIKFQMTVLSLWMQDGLSYCHLIPPSLLSLSVFLFFFFQKSDEAVLPQW